MVAPDLAEWISPVYLKPQTITRLRQRFVGNKPFPYLELRDFFHKKKAKDLHTALLDEEFTLKESDLFTFLQTADLVSTANPVLSAFHALLRSPSFVTYLMSLTGLPLQHGRLDMSGAVYQDTHHLLCHDDQLDDRRLAYTYYLSTLKSSDGGGLHLYGQRKKIPATIVKNILPRFNSLVIFAVSPLSFHEVGEVVATKDRISISGWFYGR